MRVGFIGAGAIARVHAKALREIADVKISAVCDLSEGLARCFAEQFQIERWYTHHHRMLETANLDVVFVTTPVSSHTALATDALHAGAHVLVEKPITPNYEKWQELRQASLSARRIVVENQNYRLNSPIVRLKDFIKSGDFGEVLHVDMMYALPIHTKGSPFADPCLPNPILGLPGGAILDFLPHMTYLVNEFLGNHQKVMKLWIKRDSSTILPHDEFRALIECDRGTASIAFSSHAQPAGFWLSVSGTKMYARANLFEGILVINKTGKNAGPVTYLKNGLRDSFTTCWRAFRSFGCKLKDKPMGYEGLRAFDRHFLDAMRHNEAPPVSLEQIDSSNRLIHDLTLDVDS
jgi:predicted dehydrogenase